MPVAHLLCNWKSVPLNLSHPYLSSLPIPFSNHLSVLYIYKSLSILLCLFLCLSDSTHRWNHIVFVILWLNSVSIIPSRSVFVVINGKVSFLYGCVTILYIYIYICHIFFIHSSIDRHLGYFHICLCAKSLQSYPTLCDPMDCSFAGSSVRRIL